MTGTMFGRPGHRMSAEEAVTVRQLADLTGFPVRRIVRLINRTPLTQIRFAVAVTLATGEWDWLDGETGQWSRDGTKQQEKLQRYAASLTEAEPCTDPSFPNGRITKPQLPGSSQG